ncbi:hypothetical protein AB0395_29690 [Streptosporangium sp. NPDC051023]|uniref:hypothetical protein n=1 Tax=Streptosporangium sp. NPDC051023 TaxID=3155410 RepID=UPI003450D3A6
MTDIPADTNGRPTIGPACLLGAMPGRGKSSAAHWRLLAAALPSGNALTVTDLKQPAARAGGELNGGAA